MINVARQTSGALGWTCGPAAPAAVALGRRAWQRPLEVAIACLIAALVVDCFLLGGVVPATRVSSGSMAPGLLGPHRQWHCGQCGQTFACSIESLPTLRQNVECPQCRSRQPAVLGVDQPGERLLVDRVSADILSRWQVAVCRVPEAAAQLCVKRLVGLPGESVSLVDGDLWIDHRRAERPLEAIRPLLVPLYRGNIERGWRADSHAWKVESRRAVYLSATGDDVSWLTYQHAAPAGQPRQSAAVVWDESPCDQNESRLLNPVRDLALVTDLCADGHAVVILRLCVGDDEFRLTLDRPNQTARLQLGEQCLAECRLPSFDWRKSVRLELLCVDGQARWTLAGTEMAAVSYRPSAQREPQVMAALGGRGGRIELDQIQLLRDVYYTAPDAASSQYRLGADEYFVLSDNSAQGTDSRHWAGAGGMRRELIVGRALGRP